MSRRFISLVLAASVAVTGLTAAPVRAGDSDVMRALTALAGIVVLGAAIHDARQNQRYFAPQRYTRPIYSGNYRPKAQAAASRTCREDDRDDRSARATHAQGHIEDDQSRYSARPR